MDYSSAREKFVEWIRKQMMGTAMPGPLQALSPLDRYPCGVLSPVIAEEGLDPAEGDLDEQDDDAGITDEDSKHKAQPVAHRRRYVPPSSVGFSFFVVGGNWQLQVKFSSVRYKMLDNREDSGRFVRREYERQPLGGDEDAICFTEPRRVDVMEGRAGIDVKARPYMDGEILTVTLFNRQTMDGSYQDGSSYLEDRCKKSLFEAELRCYMDNGEVGNYPRVEYSLLSEEEQELELRYSKRKIRAVGHGAAADWQEENGIVSEIFTDFMPMVRVPQVTAEVSDENDRVLEMGYLSTFIENRSEVCDELLTFVAGYESWVADRRDEVDRFGEPEREVGGRITDRMQKAVERMLSGVELLQQDDQAALAFALANRAMLNQMRHGGPTSSSSESERSYKWRPFQLAFLLTAIESTIDEDNEYRDTVDLIWFPTGGGKTEAYLGLIAFLAVWRRLKFPDSGGGTVALMRYTLRLLTTQQYLRASRMICALELIRMKNADLGLGKEPITIGLWIGRDRTPNTFRQAKKIVDKISSGNISERENLGLDQCPWCKTKFTGPDNYQASQDSFSFCCTNNECDFSKNGSGIIPCNVVDEALYQSPPTLLIATIDKFASLAWDERTGSFLGANKPRPPELLIQDELHLISGALGSVAGVYEAALQVVLAQRGVRPKYIASTATIRMADDQVKRLYGSKVAVFPPPGLDCDDSYFARTEPLSNERPGRLYMGYFAPKLNRQNCMAPLAAALLAAPEAVFNPGTADREDLLDAWWTQIVYHGSLKGVGNSHNALSIGVRESFDRLKREAHERLKNGTGEEQTMRKSNKNTPPIARMLPKVEQLTSIATPEKNAEVFSQLERDRSSNDCLDVVLATNMVSVGLDVARLALMVINGQPLTTAEYIQASSRVGRSDVPGIVCINYYRDQARSLSHYENFRPYHESFYRFVEPTSVTPFTWQARVRALHAALVVVVRHSCPYLLANDSAEKFDPNNETVSKAVEMLKRRCAQSDPEREEEISAHLDNLVKEWRDYVTLMRDQQIQLYYQVTDGDRAKKRLLYMHGDNNGGLWPTLRSMRNVENSALLKMT